MNNKIDPIIIKALGKAFQYKIMLAYCFGRPWEKQMESEQYQKDNFIRRSVMDKIRKMKQESELATKEMRIAIMQGKM